MINNTLKFIVRNLQVLHTGIGVEKLLAAFKLATVPTAFVIIIEGVTRWYIVNQWFMVFVFAAVALDHILGTIVHAFYKRDFSKKENIKGLLTKLGASITGYIIFTMIHEILKDAPFVADYFKILIQLMVLIYPAGSAMGNLSVITNGKFPPIVWMRKLEKFQENLDLNNFKTTNNEANTHNNSDDSAANDVPEHDEK